MGLSYEMLFIDVTIGKMSFDNITEVKVVSGAYILERENEVLFSCPIESVLYLKAL